MSEARGAEDNANSGGVIQFPQRRPGNRCSVRAAFVFPARRAAAGQHSPTRLSFFPFAPRPQASSHSSLQRWHIPAQPPFAARKRTFGASPDINDASKELFGTSIGANEASKELFGASIRANGNSIGANGTSIRANGNSIGANGTSIPLFGDSICANGAFIRAWETTV
jgi:hypothetical protein